MSIEERLEELRRVLEHYADPEAYWQEEVSAPYVSNNVGTWKYDCTSVDADEAKDGLKVLAELQQVLIEGRAP